MNINQILHLIDKYVHENPLHFFGKNVTYYVKKKVRHEVIQGSDSQYIFLPFINLKVCSGGKSEQKEMITEPKIHCLRI